MIELKMSTVQSVCSLFVWFFFPLMNSEFTDLLKNKALKKKKNSGNGGKISDYFQL